MKRTVQLSATIVLAASALSACGGDSGDDGKLTVWTLESQPERVAVLEDLAADYTADGGPQVEVVAIDESQYDQLLTSSASAGELPDVIGGLDLTGVGALAANGLLDEDAPAEVVDSLGEDTFSAGAIERATIDGQLAAVPSDSWVNVLVYRKDLFEKAGLAAPDDYESILAAAKKLDKPGQVGFSGFTTNHEVLEHLALGNGCDLVDDSDKVVIDSAQCVEAFDTYNELITKYSSAGEQDPDATRATYLAGGSAMAVYSSFILDELAGLNPELKPSCDECADNPAFLAENSGVVTGIAGPSGEPAQFGKQTNWTIPVEAHSDAAGFVEFMMSDGYEDWIAMAPEGKVPARRGTSEDSEAYVSAWEGMESGVEPRAPLADYYPAEVIDQIAASPETIQEWGIDQGQAPLVGAMLGEQPIVAAMTEMFAGSLTPREAADKSAEDVTQIQESLK
ncbi:MAG: ABC transporter substrate-binding protein [Nocardioides sp.]|uniref:ABC transporter substrate-binding protein n=1 Tax=Nocardioides sp. TaxID=35761 RepID=UPI003D6B0613